MGHIVISWYHYSFDVVFASRISISVIWVSGSFGLYTHRLSSTATSLGIGNIEQDILALIPSTQPRYPAYCWVSSRRWHSYPIVGRRDLPGPRLRRARGGRPHRSFPCISYPTRLASSRSQLVSLHLGSRACFRIPTASQFPPSPSSAICSARPVVVLDLSGVVPSEPIDEQEEKRISRLQQNILDYMVGWRADPRIYLPPPWLALAGRCSVGSARGASISLPFSWLVSPPHVFLGFGTPWSCLLLPFSRYRTVAWRPLLFLWRQRYVCYVPLFILSIYARMPLLSFDVFLSCTIFMHPSTFWRVLPHSVSISHHRLIAHISSVCNLCTSIYSG
ncbi:hypothetical protein C8T65DRAFT_75370 [Cerioporus squamosus]|nr:hypothetical protein C8T65DRAFT_75370 [Cerioporus squamosus]